MNPEWQKLIDELISSGYLKTPEIIDVFRTIDRKDFVLPENAEQAYGNYPLPIGGGQTISQPLTVALMLELLAVKPGDKVLDVGSGSGWVTALLAKLVSPHSTSPIDQSIGLVGRVVAVERIPELCEFGKKNVSKYNLIAKSVVKMLCGDATVDVPAEGPFDKIIAGAAASTDIPELWRNALKTGGVVVAPIGGSIWRFTKKTETAWQKEEFPGFAFVPLVKGKPPETEKPRHAGFKPEKKGIGRGALMPIILFFISLGFSYAAYATFAPKTLGPKKIKIEIPEGAGVRQIGNLLKTNGLVRSQWLFVAWAALTGNSDSLRHGQYEFVESISIQEMVTRLGGTERSARELTITIPEGWNLSAIAGYLEAQGFFSKEEFFAITGEPRKTASESEVQKNIAARFPFLNELPRGANLEGYLFPDTYRVFRNAPPEDIAAKMLGNFDKKITAELKKEISRQGYSLHEIITMASLIEKEVPHEEDRAIVSGILRKRLELGIGLQVDATIAYITERRSVKIYREELEIDSPYNTYKYRGLPPGPIANPGLSAIKAAVFPKPSPYLYYLSAPDGQTIFSKTLEEHNTAKLKYLK